MRLQDSGAITLTDIADALKDDARPFYMGDEAPRKLAEKETGAIYITDFYGKSTELTEYIKDYNYIAGEHSTVSDGVWYTSSIVIQGNCRYVSLDSTTLTLGSSGRDSHVEHAQFRILINGTVVYSKSLSGSTSLSGIVLKNDTDASDTYIQFQFYSGAYSDIIGENSYREGYRLDGTNINMTYIYEPEDVTSEEETFDVSYSNNSTAGNQWYSSGVLFDEENVKKLVIDSGSFKMSWSSANTHHSPIFRILINGQVAYSSTGPTTNKSISSIVLRDDEEGSRAIIVIEFYASYYSSQSGENEFNKAYRLSDSDLRLIAYK